MCDIPSHSKGNSDHDLLHAIDEKIDEMALGQHLLISEVFGTGTTKGLSTKVDEIREGHIEGGKKTAAWTGGFVASVIAIISGVIQQLGLK
jgi:hypothetical protein